MNKVFTLLSVLVVLGSLLIGGKTSYAQSDDSCQWVKKDPECDWNTHQVYEVSQDSCTGAYFKSNYHFQDGVCGYSSTQSQPTTSCNWVQKNPECDWNTHEVYDLFQDSCTGVYFKKNYHFQVGVCGYNQAAATAPACNLTADQYPQCGGTCNGVTYDSTHTVYVQRGVNSNSCSYTWNCQDLGAKVGECGNPAQQIQQQTYQAPAQTSTPVYQAPVYQTPITYVAPVYTAPTPIPIISGPIQSWPTSTPIPTPIQPSIGGPTANTQVNCPSGTSPMVNNSTIVCVSSVAVSSTGPINVVNTNTNTVNPPQVVLASATTAPVVYTVDQLPKTGLPIEAWSLSGMLPVGLGLKKFGSFKKLAASSPQFIWQLREFNKKGNNS